MITHHRTIIQKYCNINHSLRLYLIIWFLRDTNIFIIAYYYIILLLYIFDIVHDQA